MQLIGPQFESRIEAIGNAFDYDTLERCLRLKLARKLDHIIAVPQRLPDLIFDLLDTANREGWVRECELTAKIVSRGAKSYYYDRPKVHLKLRTLTT